MTVLTLHPSAVPAPGHFFGKLALMAARKMYPDRCISVSDGSGSISIDAMHALHLEAAILEIPGRLLSRAKPADVPNAIHEIVVQLLDEVKGDMT